MTAFESVDEEIIAEINLTPLVDVSLVLVIIFMVIAPFFAQILKPLRLPAASKAGLTDQNTIKVSIYPDGTMAVGATFIDLAQMGSALQKEVAAGRPPWALVRASAEVSHSRVMQVVKALRESGIRRLAFAAQPKQANTMTEDKP